MTDHTSTDVLVERARWQACRDDAARPTMRTADLLTDLADRLAELAALEPVLRRYCPSRPDRARRGGAGGQVTTATLNDQKAEALRLANRVRAERAHLKRRWKVIDPHAARWELRGLILQTSTKYASWPVDDALYGLPGFGKIRIRNALVARGILPGAKLGKLTDRQRVALNEWLA